MTTFDDALAADSITYGPHQLTANWRELDTNISGNVDHPSFLSDQFNTVMTVSHSLDDALPDPVTMTTGSDAAGVMAAGLNGREGLTYASSGVRAFDTGGGSWDSATATKVLTSPIPASAVKGDFLIACVVINDSTAFLTQTLTDPKNAWEYAGNIVDGTYAMHVYYFRRWWSGIPQLTLASTKSVNYMSATNAFWASNPTGIPLDYRVTDIQFKAEAASVTGHTIAATLSGKGYIASYFASSAGTMAVVAPQVLQGSITGSGVVLLSGYTGLLDSGNYIIGATSAPATAVVPMAAIAVEPFARPRWDARQYFSPFNKDSPLYGVARDTAGVMASIRVLTTDGPVDTQIFAGQSQDVPIQGRAAQINAVSKTRIRLNRSLTLPNVSGLRENCTVDWLATWLLSRGSQFVGPAVNRYTRYWAPLYGSVHSHYDSPNSYNATYIFQPPGPPGGPYGSRFPAIVSQGKWMTAMYAQQTSTQVLEVYLNPSGKLYETPENAFPHIEDAGGPLNYDVFSKANSRGRISFWIRGDAAAASPSWLDPTRDLLFSANVQVNSRDNTILGFVKMMIDSTNRRAQIQIGNLTTGYSTVTFAASGLLPSDGAWHFVGFWWDYAAGTARVRVDSGESSSTAWTPSFNDTTILPATDEEGRRNSSNTYVFMRAHLPISDVMYDAGQAYTGAGFWDDQQFATGGANVTMRATNMRINALAEPSAVNAWDTLADLARNTLSAYRVNEADNYEFLPLSYFGEAAQLTSSAVHDTRYNAADLDVVQDPSQIRNVVTIEFQDTRSDSMQQPVLTMTSALTIPRGTSLITFPLDVLIVEFHGAGSAGGSSTLITNLTSSQISTPSIPSGVHVMTVNTSSDGSGSVLPSVQVKGQVISSDASTMTVQFTNLYSANVYLANNGDGVPFLRLMGYGVRINDGYVTERDQSDPLRGERALTAEMNWIQSRDDAGDLAITLAAMLSQPRPQLSLNVMGDPRRKPGQLVTIADSDGTGAAGTWRVLKVEHGTSGAEYTQDLRLVRVHPTAVWDGSDGWDESTWSV